MPIKTQTQASLKNKRALVIGLGISGRAAAGFLLRRGARVTGIDQNITLLHQNAEIATLRQQGMTAAHAKDPIDVTSFDMVVVSPGIPQSDPLYVMAKKSGVDLIGEVELACRSLKNKMLGITGTNGKTTTTLLVTHILSQSGIPASSLGNSGVALTSVEAENAIASDNVVVAELSSYQLETMTNRVLDAAVLLNITPDHLDRYSGMEEYAAAKLHIANCLKPKGVLYIEDKCFKEYGHLLGKSKAKTYGFDPKCHIYSDLKSIIVDGKRELDLPTELSGKATHDLENIMAAYALCHYMGVKPAQFLAALTTFKKPAHRIEFVREMQGVTFFDDSKGTNLDAVIKAVDMMAGKVILIAGGVDKGAAYTPWIAAFADKVKCICAIGQAAPKMEGDLSHKIPVKRFNTLQDAVNFAAKMAQKGDNVLLSPGCSSFDMFRDYAHRGEEFQRIVKGL